MALEVFLLVLCLAGAMLWPTTDAFQARRRLAALRPETPIGQELAAPLSQRLLAPLWHASLRWLRGATPRDQRERLRDDLQAAGLSLSVEALLMLRLALVLPGLAFLPLGARGLLLALTLGTLGWRLPLFWVKRRQHSRRQRMQALLPSVLDILALSLEAGAAFDQALQQAQEHLPEPVRAELGRVLADMRLGRSRTEAFAAWGQRSGIASLRRICHNLAQAERLGIGMARLMRLESEDLRRAARQDAEEAALKTPIKLLFPLVFCIFPALFVVLLGPIVLRLMSTLG